MAKEPKKATKRAAKKSAPRKTSEQKIISATFELAADHDWSEIKLSQIAKAAKVPLAELTNLFSSKTDILIAHISQVDNQVLSNLDPEMDVEPARERLLDVMISRIEALTQVKMPLKRIKNSLPRDPAILGRLNQALVASMNKMLIAASCETSGLRGVARAQGMVHIYKASLDVWLEDDDPGMARTMAELDRRLRRGERMLKRADMVVNMARGAVGVGKSFCKQARERRKNRPSEDVVTT